MKQQGLKLLKGIAILLLSRYFKFTHVVPSFPSSLHGQLKNM